MAAESFESLLKEAQSIKETNPGRAERIYQTILEESSKDQKAGPSNGNEQRLRDQEVALVKLGELYRDTKCVGTICNFRIWANSTRKECARIGTGAAVVQVIHDLDCEGKDCET